jgi:hypothetical protein
MRCMPQVLPHFLPSSSDFLLYSRIEMLIDYKFPGASAATILSFVWNTHEG